MEELDALRLQGVRLLAVLSGLACLAVTVGAAFAGSGFVPVLLALVLAVFPVLAALRRAIDPLSRTVLGATMPLFCAVLLFQWSGGTWMIDLHMIFFAAIAVVAVLADWRPLLAGATVTAVHHLALNFVAPVLVFGGSGDLGRVVLHAVVVVVETGALVQIAVMLEAVLITRAQAAAAAAAIELAATREREQSAAAQNHVVTALAEGLRRLASGDLACRIAVTFPASFEPVRVDFNQALVGLEGVVGQVVHASGQIQAGASLIRTASQELAERTEVQASTVESVRRTVGELVGVAGDTLGRAQSAGTAIMNSAERVKTGHAVVAKAIETMERIQTSSGEIGQIVSLIDGIAFQTNLLALNAGVEAARAGDSGRGFAVVATEVRALAQRSADAARDIKVLITASTTQVGEGVELVGQTGIVLRDVVQDVEGFTQSVDAITRAVGETARDLAGLRDTFAALDQTTQKNAAMVEESHAALHSLTDETNVLVDVASRFSTSDRPSGGTQRRGRAMAA